VSEERDNDAATRRAGSLGIGLLTLAHTARVCAPTIVDGALGRLHRDKADLRIRQWTAGAVELADVSIEVEGLEHVDAEETYVVMSNHQSNFDIFTMFHAFPGTLRMVAKVEMRRLPLLGRAMEAAEFVFVNRADNSAARASLDAARELMQSGVSVWIAPEGTRSSTGHLGAFKKGGFMLALTAGVRILPATLVGTREVLPIKSLRVRRSRAVTIRFHPPVDTARFGLARRDQLMNEVRASIASMLPPELRAPADQTAAAQSADPREPETG
jgi:1-acyl-sn-glycerol-3-phosphate acyltransferase